MKGLKIMTEFERYIQQTNKQSKYNNGGNAIDNYIKHKNKTKPNGSIDLAPLLKYPRIREKITTAIEKEIIKQIKTVSDKKA